MTPRTDGAVATGTLGALARYLLATAWPEHAGASRGRRWSSTSPAAC
ncbi:MAG TPA: hypothetical protein VI011_04360 [Asanoa sp.]